MGQLDGLTVFVTGAGGGLGRSHAIEIARQGANLALFDLGDGNRDAEPGYTLSNQADLDAAASQVRALERRCLVCTGDVRSQQDLDRAVDQTLEEFGRIDGVVVNAGVIMTSSVWEMTRANWDLLMEINLTGAWQTMKAVVPHMIRNKSGRIVVISSEAGLKGLPDIGAYCASKAGVIGLSKSLAIELGPYLVTVNMICPGSIPTGANRGVAEQLGRPWEELVSEWREEQAMPVALAPADVSHAVTYFLSNQARYVTGAILSVDAGSGLL